MGKKVKEYKSGDFIFAKVKGYPAWPARVQRMNGKKYFVYFYGTGETANLAPNMIFDYVENKDKFLTKTVKRRDFNDGVKQIEHDFANNVPLELVIGAALEDPADSANDSAIDTTADQTADDSAMDTTTADDTVADTTTNTTAQNETGVEDSDDAGALVIDEGKQPPSKQKKSKAEAPKATSANTPKTPRGRARRTPEDPHTPAPAVEAPADDKLEEIVSRSGRKIRPKRYIDEHTDENATLPSPAAKKRRPTPPIDVDTKEKEKTDKQADKQADKQPDKNVKQYNNVSQSDIEDLKEPYKPADPAKENILIAQVPGGKYVGIKIWESRPRGQGAASALQWERTAAANALRLKAQIEKGQVKPQSVAAHLVMDLNLTDEEKAALDKERETEEKKSRVQFLKTEMRLIELDAKIKSCLCLEKADTESCLQLLDQMTELDIAPLMLLKHPTCVETVKRMRAYVGNATSWELTEEQAAQFSKHAHTIRKRADTLYKRMKDLFPLASCDPSVSFWEVFSAKAAKLKQLAANNKGHQYDLLEMVHEPPELSEPTPHTMQSALDAADEQEPPLKDDDDLPLTNNKQAKSKKPSTPAKTPAKRNAKNKDKQDKEQKQEENKEKDKGKDKEEVNKDKNKQSEKVDDGGDDKGDEEKQTESATETNVENENAKPAESPEDKTEGEKETTQKEAEKEAVVNKEVTNNEAEDKINDVAKEKDIVNDVTKENDKEIEKNGEKVDDKEVKAKEDTKKEEKKKEDKELQKDEPRAKRSRGESKKTEPPPPRSPTKRKSKA